jgi:hypothetical protein
MTSFVKMNDFNVIMIKVGLGTTDVLAVALSSVFGDGEGLGDCDA